MFVDELLPQVHSTEKHNKEEGGPAQNEVRSADAFGEGLYPELEDSILYCTSDE